MTMPDALAAPMRAAAVAEAAAPSGPLQGSAAQAGGEGFAQTLADVIGPAAGKTPEGAEAMAKAEVPTVMLDDLGKLAALLPSATAEALVEAPVPEEAAAPPAAAMQAAMAVLMPKVVIPGSETEIEAGVDEDVVADVDSDDVADPLAALGLAAAVTPAPAFPPPEGEAAVGQAVSAALAGGALQPMMQQQVKAPTPPPSSIPGEAGMDGAVAVEGEDAPIAIAEAVQRREAAGLTPVLVQAVAQEAARPGAEPGPVIEAVPGTTTANGQVPQQVAPGAAQGPVTAGFAAPALIATDRPGWEGAIADRIAAELSGDGQQIDLELAPDHLGRLKIRLDMTDGQALVRFVTETPEAARLIQANEHRLSDALSRAGLSLGGQETTSRDPQGDRPARGAGPVARFLDRPVEGLAATLPGRAARGLVNLIA